MPKVSSVIVPYASYLRVYEPLAAFPEPEREPLGALRPRAPSAPPTRTSCAARWPTCCPRRRCPVPVHESGDAFVLEVDGVVCVCPWRTRLRGWQALDELAEELPPPGAGRGAPAGRAPPGRRGLRALAGPQPGRPPLDPHVDLAGAAELVRARLRRGARVRQGGRRTERRRCCATGRRWCRRGAGWRGRCARSGTPSTRGRSSTAWWTWGAGWRSSIRARWSSWTTAAWCTRCRPGELEDDHSAADVAEGIEALRRGDGDAGRGGVRAAGGALAGGAGPALGELNAPRCRLTFDLTPLLRSSSHVCPEVSPRDVGPDPGFSSASSVMDRTYWPLRLFAPPRAKIGQGVRGGLRSPSVRVWAGISALHAMGGLVTPDRHCD